MSGQFRENWKRLVNKLPQSNQSTDNSDIIRFQDLASYSGTLSSQDLHVDHIHYRTPVTIPEHEEGISYWDEDDHTLNLMTEVSGTTIQVGQEMVLRGVNRTGSIILNGQVVYVDGAQGNRPSIRLASASNHDAAQQTIGLVTTNILNNEVGYITTFGLVRNIDTSAVPEGSGVYLQVAPGVFGAEPPIPPLSKIYLGTCIRSHATIGILFTKILNTGGIDELHDVHLEDIQDGDVLSWSAASGAWLNNTPVAGSGGDPGSSQKTVVQATGIITSPQVLTADDSGKVFVGGTTVANYFTLPALSSPTTDGIQYLFLSDGYNGVDIARGDSGDLIINYTAQAASIINLNRGHITLTSFGNNWISSGASAGWT